MSAGFRRGQDPHAQGTSSSTVSDADSYPSATSPIPPPPLHHTSVSSYPQYSTLPSPTRPLQTHGSSAHSLYAASSVLGRYLNTPNPRVNTPSRNPSSASGSAAHQAGSSLNSSFSAFYRRHTRARSTAATSLRILPLPHRMARGGNAVRAEGGANFLVVASPFVIVVDCQGEPDPLHTILDIPQSLEDTPLGGEAVSVLDATVLADKVFIAVHSWLIMCGPLFAVCSTCLVRLIALAA
jgi:hypothetical protein